MTIRTPTIRKPGRLKVTKPAKQNIEMIAVAQHVGNGNWFVQLEFDCINGLRGRELLPRSILNNLHQLRTFLSDRGWQPPVEGKEVLTFLQNWAAQKHKPPQLWLTDQTGWVEKAYVFADKVVGPEAHLWLYTPTKAPKAGEHVSGTLEKWSELIAMLLVHSPYLVFVVAVALASMLVKPLGLESCIFHLHGTGSRGARSSIGKTLAVMLGSSVIRSGKRSLLSDWDTSKPAIAELAATRNDSLVVFDEVAKGSHDPKVLAGLAHDMAFLVAAGKPRTLSNAYKAGSTASWDVQGVSTGEQAIAELVSSDRLKGAEVRLIDVPIVVSGNYGIFDSLPDGFDTSAKLAKALERRCAMHFGHPARVFAERFLEDPDAWKHEARKYMKWFKREAKIIEGGWEERLGDRFALVYAAARVATKMGILPWTRYQTFGAVAHCYRAAMAAFPDIDKRVDDACDNLRDKLASTLKLVDLRSSKNGSPSVADLENADGFIKKNATDGPFCALKPEVLGNWVAPLPPEMVLERMRHNGHLVTTIRRSLYKQVLVKRLKSDKRPYACIRLSFFTDGSASSV